MSSNRKVKGYRFRRHNGKYYLAHGMGSTYHKAEAFIYSALQLRTISVGWGHKTQGTWEILFE